VTAGRLGRDDGFTLLEMVLAVSIMGLLVACICGALFVTMQTTRFTLNRQGGTLGTVQDSLYSAHDEQVADAYYSSDVESSQSITASRPPCYPAVTGVVVTSLADFSWTDSAGVNPTSTSYAWYFLVRPTALDGSADLTQLGQVRRAYCTQTTASPPVVTRQGSMVIARAVGPTAPSFVCDGHALPCVTDPAVGTPVKVATLQMRLGLDSSLPFGLQAERRMVTG